VVFPALLTPASHTMDASVHACSIRLIQNGLSIM
jgi:hypothetical protein